ncbi:MAG: DUF2490 domain-containing protein [Bacteroidota bacterium]
MHKPLRVAIVWMALFLSADTAYTQTEGMGSWMFFYGKVKFNQKWFAFLEPHLLTQKPYHDYNYYEYNAGLGYTLSKSVNFTAAFGQYETYQPDGDFKSPLQNNEFRLWEQVAVNSYIGRIKVENRYRLEQRYTSASGYRNRFRYRLAATVPLNHTVQKAGTVFFNWSDEIFITNEAPYFETNWLYTGVGYQFTDHLSLQAGWLNKFNQSISHVTYWKNYLQTSCVFTINAFRQPKK